MTWRRLACCSDKVIRMRNLCILVGCLSVLLRTSAGELLLVGGGLEESNAEVLSRFIELAGGQGVAKIGCITTASSEPVDSGQYYEDLFLSYGAASATYIPVTQFSNNADTAEIEALVREQTGFFFGGGDQARIISAWVRSDGTDTIGMAAIRDIVNNGGVLGGTSAGSACQGSGPMVEGGLSWQALNFGASTSYDDSNPDNLFYIENGGLGFLDNFIVDTHYSERGREGRMIELLLDTGKNFALGIDENTGVQISPDGSAEILGAAGGAMVIDMRAAVRSSVAPTSVSGIKVTFYTEDDKFSVSGGSSTYASWKSNLSGDEYYSEASSSSNIFSSPDKPVREYSVFRDTSQRLWDSEDESVTSYSYESNPTFSVTMRKASGSGYGGYSPVDDSFQISYHEMLVDIEYS